MNMILERSIYEHNSPAKQTLNKPLQNDRKPESINSYQRRSNSMAVNPLINNMGNLINTKLYLAPQDINFYPRLSENEEIPLSSQFSESENRTLIPPDFW